MSLRRLILLRKFSTSGTLRRPKLSNNYKSKELWDERYSCKLLGGDEGLLRSINRKIILGTDLNNLEVDIFINIAAPSSNEIAQLQESVRLLSRFRKSLYAFSLLPSTHHAVCRLFLYSQRLSSLITLLENRIEFGIFPDFFTLNLSLDYALDKETYASASRLAALVMLQEEFGINMITDILALFAVARYIESKTDFEDWKSSNTSNDPILTGAVEQTLDQEEEIGEKSKQKETDVNEDEEEDDAEYIRVPFLRNPYFDNHFDITNPRIICGKTLSMLGNISLKEDDELGVKSRFIGSILQGKWSEAIGILNKCVKLNIGLGSIKEISKFYTENLNGIDAPTDDQKTTLLLGLENVSTSDNNLSELVELKGKNLSKFEDQDIQQLRASYSDWSEIRSAAMKTQEDKIYRENLMAEIRAKKEELKHQEQYLYFFENLKKSRITKIDYN